MRVRLAKNLLKLLESGDDYLHVTLQLKGPVTSGLEAQVASLTRHIVSVFNKYASNEAQPIDYVSDPNIYDPHEAQFDISVEHLGRVAREQLLRLLPDLVSAWAARFGASIETLQLGEGSEMLNREDKKKLHEAMDELRSSAPVKGREFVLGSDLPVWFKESLQSRLQELGAIIEEEVPGCDYFVSDNDELAIRATEVGAKVVVDTVMVRVIVST